ncbi:MAG: hypothetical protein RLZZ227_1503 [Pseudomonadota bacterium]|jgi:hypothetical protein
MTDTMTDLIDALNKQCFCASLDTERLRAALEAELGTPGLAELVRERCPYLFSASPVFVSHAHMQRMTYLIAAIEAVIALPAWRDAVLAWAPATARYVPGNKGVFFGYDFHVAPQGFGLIEINTNAGGAMLNAVLAHAQFACCDMMRDLPPLPALGDALEQNIVAMFRSEWTAAGRQGPLRTLAIVDSAPRVQYLYPEFLLFQHLFERHGMHAVIVDPAELQWRDGKLWHGRLDIDLVYNRLTDFALEAPAHAALRSAYLQDAVVLTPHPHAHALYADKRNMTLLTDPAALAAMGVPAALQELLLAGIPRTEIVTAANMHRLWSERRKHFFKPFAGYGGRAAYRGDKLTRRVWEAICQGGYVAQALLAPGERALAADGTQVMKFDLRNYVYAGAVQWVAARLYQGQTTNFRTPAGGFAPVYAGAD